MSTNETAIQWNDIIGLYITTAVLSLSVIISTPCLFNHHNSYLHYTKLTFSNKFTRIEYMFMHSILYIYFNNE